MKRFVTIGAMLASLAVSAMVFDQLMRPQLGDARMANHLDFQSVTNILFDVEVPAGEWHAITVTAWMRIYGYSPSNMQFITTQAFYCPEAMERFNPDMASNAFGFTTPINITGTVTVAGFPWAVYTGRPVTNIWTNGVCTVAGWASNEVVVSLGGTEATVGPGTFNRNVIPGNGTDAAITTTGEVSIGISHCPVGEFFNNVDGVFDTNSVQGQMTGESVVTNEISFCSWRIMLDGSNHIYRSDLTRMDRCTTFGLETTNAQPYNATALSSKGIYKFGLTGSLRDAALNVEVFDARLQTRWLTDDELCRIWTNGVTEVERREIERWK